MTTAFQGYYPDDLAQCYGCGRRNEHGRRIKSCWDGDEARVATGEEQLAGDTGIVLFQHTNARSATHHIPAVLSRRCTLYTSRLSR